MKHISVIIPTYNGKHLLDKHLPAVFACLRTGDEVVIIDDHSSDASVAWLVQKFELENDLTPKNVAQEGEAAFSLHRGFYKGILLTIVANHQNVRFGQAVNRGIEVSKHQHILLLNSDVKPLPGVIEALLPYFEDNSVFGVGCLEQEPGKNNTIVWGGKNKLWFSKGMFIHSRADSYDSGSTAWVSGGSGMFDKAKWQQLGGFDRAYYPAYWEDIDISYRARKKGWQVLFESKAVVEHHHETTNNDVCGQAKIEAMSWKNAQVFVWKNGTISQRILHVFWKPYWWWQQFKRRQHRSSFV
jgi:GT2 family glycosyltransferase